MQKPPLLRVPTLAEVEVGLLCCCVFGLCIIYIYIWSYVFVACCILIA